MIILEQIMKYYYLYQEDNQDELIMKLYCCIEMFLQP